MLDAEEYIEQTHLFRALAERSAASEPIQETLRHIKHEVLATTKLPMAIDFLLAELNHAGNMASAMARMPHYFTSFQTYLIESAESEHGQFDIRRALLILQHEAGYRAGGVSPSGLFFFQFETLCRNKLSYDLGLDAISRDPAFDDIWRKWILKVRHKIGLVDIADLVFVHSLYYVQREQQSGLGNESLPDPILFDEKEGRIALANRRKEPLFFFSALQRQLHYPTVPLPTPRDEKDEILKKLSRQFERMETRVKLLEDEQREKGIDLSKFYGKPVDPPTSADDTD